MKDNNDYYPFGMNHLKTGTSYYGVGKYQNYKYNGKELQETGMYDYGARFYMADIGRWGTHDPLSELQFPYSPYSYVFNNPIYFTDPTGMIGESCDTCPDKSKNPEINPNAKGGTNNPIDIQEVVITGYKKVQSEFLVLILIN